MLAKSATNVLKHNSTLEFLPCHQVIFQLDDCCCKISQAFENDSDLPGVLLFSEGKLLTMVSRSRYLEIMNLPYSKELFLQKKIKKIVPLFNKPDPIYPPGTYIGKAVEEVLERDEKHMEEPIVYESADHYSVIDNLVLLKAHAKIFSLTIKKLQAEIKQSNELREQLEIANEAAEKMARLDSLTGIPNRRNLDEYLTREWQRAIREKKQLSVILIDIDYFKSFNDSYGHQSGDEALKKVATCLSSEIHRPADFLARFGGEEFIAILPDTSLVGAFSVAEKMRQAVLALEIPHSNSTLGKFLTISCGVSCLVPTEPGKCRDVIQLADRALYKAKSEGRNQVFLSQQEFTETLWEQN